MKSFPYTFVKKIKLNKLSEEYTSLQTQIMSAADFIKEIEKGNLEAKYYEEECLTEKDIDDQLADSLIKLRKQMIIVSVEEKQRNWVAETRSKFIDILRSKNDDLRELASDIIQNLVKCLSANQGGLYLINDDDPDNAFIELLACYAYERKKFISQRIEIGQGLVGQTILEKASTYLNEIPENYLRITSGLGQSTPRHLLIVPLKVEEEVFGAVEIASFHSIKEFEIEFVEQLGESIASTIANVKNNQRTRQLLEETQQQAEEMRAQEEEVRQNMEELSATQEEMQRIMKEVQDNEAFIKGLIDSTNDSIIAIDQDYKIITCNKSTIDSYKGYGFEIEKGFDIFQLFAEDQKEKFKVYYDRALEGEFFEVNEHYKFGDKDQHFVVTYSPLRNDKGEIIGAACFGKDVTETVIAKEKTDKLLEETQQQAEEMRAQEEEIRQNMEELSATQEELLRKQEEANNILEKFDLVTQTTKEGLWDMVVPEDMNIHGNTPFFWTDRFREMVGYTNEEDFPNVLHSWSDLLHPDHKQHTLDAFSKHLLDLSGKTPYDVEYQLKLKDGSYHWFRAVGNTLRDEKGNPIRIAGSLIDIQPIKDMQAFQEELENKVSERTSEVKELLAAAQQKEKFTTEILGASKDTIFVIDKKYCFLEFNATFKEALSQMGMQAEKGGDVFQVLSEEERPNHKKLYDRVFNGESFEVTEHIAVADAHYMSSYSPLRDEKGKVYACVVFAKDITETIKAKEKTEKLLEETQQQAEEMRAQEEELRQNMEELSATQEEMHKVVKEVQASEHYLKELLNVTQDIIYTLDKDAKVLTYNTYFEESMKKYGFKVEKGFDYLAILPTKEEQKSQKQIIDKVFAGELIQIPLAYEVEEGEIHLISTYSPVRNAEGEIIAAAVYSKDVTELVMAKRQQGK